jgi:hypothetical protein
MAIINLSKSIVLQPELTTNSVEVIAYWDNPSAKQVTATLKMNEANWTNTIVLWSDADYDSVDQWTDAQAEARVKELLESQS